MNPQQKKLFTVIYKFHKLDIGEYIEGLSQGEFAMLSALNITEKKEGGNDELMNVSSLADDLHVSAPAVSRMLTSLEKKGYIKRSIGANNRRITYIKVTGEGREAYRKAEGVLNAIMESTIENMGHDDFSHFIALLDKLYASMEKAMPNKKD